MIPFNKPCAVGSEESAIRAAIENSKLSGNGPFTKKCTDWLEGRLQCKKALLTPSCTAALEMTAMLTETKDGDEVIMPSYTFVSTANAFVIRGGKIRFVDVTPDTMNIDPQQIEAAITDRTKSIVVVHYAGIACDMDAIMEIAHKYGLWVIEDAAQALLSTYKGKPLGTIGHFGTFSFHDTKNYTCGEGGALIINDPTALERAEIIQEKGTNRQQFKKGMVDKYTWRDIGSSFLLSELNAAYLHVQFQHANTINENRLQTWHHYKRELQPVENITIPHVPENCMHNAHMFYIKMKDVTERNQLMDYLNKHAIMTATHYVPLHSSHAGRKYGKFIGSDTNTTTESERLLRLPLYYGIGEEAVDYVVKTIHTYYQT
ncbi:dTDP-4-amino-4,6-dideoxygalactose transaminase [Lentibacillus sp. Marseille-P4043]|uniref:dTDP-4-amino-4,6-dideoxygalactose transaminase n=1 Tax=Lentibacillus sp. Marseille-P4043 TaxID=2040293 RepID=UPI000D0B5E95|nr:dTDP-4-amino-4,6-dideoxygalactose transaminase [Lentibacillus sp. Marseille-P4043]